MKFTFPCSNTYKFAVFLELAQRPFSPLSLTWTNLIRLKNDGFNEDIYRIGSLHQRAGRYAFLRTSAQKKNLAVEEKEKEKENEGRNRILEQWNYRISGAWNKAGKGYFGSGLKLRVLWIQGNHPSQFGPDSSIVKGNEHTDRWTDGHDGPIMLSFSHVYKYAKMRSKNPFTFLTRKTPVKNNFAMCLAACKSQKKNKKHVFTNKN